VLATGREITDNLIELLIRIAHRVGVRAEEGREGGRTLRFAKRSSKKRRPGFKLAKAAKGSRRGLGQDVILSRAVGEEETLEELVIQRGQEVVDNTDTSGCR